MEAPDITIIEKAKHWLSEDFDQETRDQVRFMVDHDHEALVEAFYRDLEFGTGGMRGIMGPGTNRMNIYIIGMATQGLCNYLIRYFPGKTDLSIAIAHDSRNNSRVFAEMTAKVSAANGIHAYLFEGLRPTPELSFAIRHLHCQSGVVVTASHNPKEYNGYKVYWEDGGQIVHPHDENIIGEVQKIKSFKEVRQHADPSLIHSIGKEVDEAYLTCLKGLSLNPESNLKHQDMKIVYTPIHGTGVYMVPEILRRFGFNNVINVPEQDIPDGNFPTVYSPNPEEKSALTLALEKARETGAELVMASDPDADRIGVAVRDSVGEYRLLNGNQTGTLLVYYLLKNLYDQKKLKGNEFIVRTIVTTPLFNEIASSFGVKTYEVLTGFKYIAGIIREKEGQEVFIGGGEESYGFMVGSFVRDKDAVSACALFAEMAAWAKENGMTVLELLESIYIKYGYYKEHLISITKKGKSGVEEISAMMERFRSQPPETLAGSDVVMVQDFQVRKAYDMISHLRYDINLPKSNVLQFITSDGSIISARPSGTEPKIKFYFSVRTQVKNLLELAAAGKALDERIKTMVADMKLDS
ncbi:MAG: phosphoglucomutase [Bacteroidetes bacterium GWF2_49_14]|nr:MAG: phosphoglucomutase [Bacteroidetes bacterium GWF2_49_14]HBB91032.1 phosphoglucomutase [Bacteroidales bacterium]